MNRFFTCLMAAGLALAAGPHAVISASPVRHPMGDVDILVDGTLQRRYAHDGRWYVEAINGREYAIRLRNPYGVRVAVALSVDGLNTIDARQTTAVDARKWVIGPYETITISGWQTSQTDARRFEFTTEARSYGQALGKTANLGVISAVFFKERAPAVLLDTSHESARQRAQRLGVSSNLPPSSAQIVGAAAVPRLPSAAPGRPAQVVKVKVGTNRNMPNALIHHRPANELQAKFSMEFCMAILLIERKGGLAQFTDVLSRLTRSQGSG